MTQYYYSAQPFLAWCINHYFYNRLHFAYVGASFYPYRLGNPRSSSPLRLYEDFYEPWKDDDTYSDFILGKTIGLLNAVERANSDLQLNLQDYVRQDLRDICQRVNIAFFYPIIYRVDVDEIRTKDPNCDDPAKSRLQKSGSGKKPIGICEKPSNEYTLRRLREKRRADDGGDFDVLLYDLDVEITLLKNYIQSLPPAPDQIALQRAQNKVDICCDMKKLWDERETLVQADALDILKKHAGM